MGLCRPPFYPYIKYGLVRGGFQGLSAWRFVGGGSQPASIPLDRFRLAGLAHRRQGVAAEHAGAQVVGGVALNDGFYGFVLDVADLQLAVVVHAA